MSQKIDIVALKETYFNDDSREIKLNQGDVLLEEGAPNTRLYLILKGTIIGNISDPEGNYYEFFRSTKDMFVGVQSFFSKSYRSVTRLVAAEKSTLTFIEADEYRQQKNALGEKALEDAIQILTHELASRQTLAHEVTIEKSNALKKLHVADKMSTLGQMAAGLAHELNNAILVLDRNTEWIGAAISEMIQIRSQENYSAFEKGIIEGTVLSTREIRERAKMLTEKLQLSSIIAKKLAKTGYDLESLRGRDLDELRNLAQYWELGAAFKDMKISAEHAIHVVKSVKELGANRSDRTDGIQINDTIREAVSILGSPLRSVTLQTDFQELPELYGNRGEFVQIWINIIKNASESLQSSKTENPVISLGTSVAKRTIRVVLTDNGPGIPHEVQKKIFEPSFTTKVGGLSFGLGLGLSIVLRLIESYEGKIRVKSHPGETSFIVEIPIDYGKD